MLCSASWLGRRHGPRGHGGHLAYLRVLHGRIPKRLSEGILGEHEVLLAGALSGAAPPPSRMSAKGAATLLPSRMSHHIYGCDRPCKPRERPLAAVAFGKAARMAARVVHPRQALKQSEALLRLQSQGTSAGAAPRACRPGVVGNLQPVKRIACRGGEARKTMRARVMADVREASNGRSEPNGSPAVLSTSGVPLRSDARGVLPLPLCRRPNQRSCRLWPGTLDKPRRRRPSRSEP